MPRTESSGSAQGPRAPPHQDCGRPSPGPTHLQVLLHGSIRREQVGEEGAQEGDDTLCRGGVWSEALLSCPRGPSPGQVSPPARRPSSHVVQTRTLGASPGLPPSPSENTSVLLSRSRASCRALGCWWPGPCPRDTLSPALQTLLRVPPIEGCRSCGYGRQSRGRKAPPVLIWGLPAFRAEPSPLGSGPRIRARSPAAAASSILSARLSPGLRA